MDDPDRGSRYGSPSVTAKVLGTLVALAMVVLGGIWAFTASGAAQTLGPILAGFGVALAYVVLIQKRH